MIPSAEKSSFAFFAFSSLLASALALEFETAVFTASLVLDKADFVLAETLEVNSAIFEPVAFILSANDWDFLQSHMSQ